MIPFLNNEGWIIQENVDKFRRKYFEQNNAEFSRSLSVGCGIGAVGSIIQQTTWDKTGHIASSRKYQQGAFLGKGSYGKVYNFKDIRTANDHAAKVFEKKDCI